MIEPTPAEEVFVTGLGLIEPRGDFVRLTFFSERAAVDTIPAHGSDPPADEHAIAVRIVCTPQRLRAIMRLLQTAMGRDDRH